LLQRKLDQLVYELYGLTDEERRISWIEIKELPQQEDTT